jgi:acyl carrier protein
MTNTEIEKSVREMLSEVKDGQNYDKTSLDREFDDAGLDSLDTATLLLSIQERYDLEINDDDAETLNTIGKLVDYIAAHKAA